MKWTLLWYKKDGTKDWIIVDDLDSATIRFNRLLKESIPLNDIFFIPPVEMINGECFSDYLHELDLIKEADK